VEELAQVEGHVGGRRPSPSSRALVPGDGDGDGGRPQPGRAEPCGLVFDRPAAAPEPDLAAVSSSPTTVRHAGVPAALGHRTGASRFREIRPPSSGTSAPPETIREAEDYRVELSGRDRARAGRSPPDKNRGKTPRGSFDRASGAPGRLAARRRPAVCLPGRAYLVGAGSGHARNRPGCTWSCRPPRLAPAGTGPPGVGPASPGGGAAGESRGSWCWGMRGVRGAGPCSGTARHRGPECRPAPGVCAHRRSGQDQAWFAAIVRDGLPGHEIAPPSGKREGARRVPPRILGDSDRCGGDGRRQGD